MTLHYSFDRSYKRATRPSGLHPVLDSRTGRVYPAVGSDEPAAALTRPEWEARIRNLRMERALDAMRPVEPVDRRLETLRDTFALLAFLLIAGAIGLAFFLEATK